MYSMVLMMAMSTSPEVAACHKTACTGCTGVVDAGCCGGGHGFLGGRKHGCSGGGFLGGHHKHGCNGGCTGVVVDAGCTGGAGCTGVVPAPAPMEVAPVPPKDMPKEIKKGGVTFAPMFAPATITVNVPADAKVTIDGNATVSTSTVRTFATPALKTGAVSYYTFVAEVVREGKTFTATETVAVEAGATTTITLNPNAGLAVASK